MAKLKWTAQEFISSSFSPMVAVATTSTVENICKRNALTFIELLAPFCKLGGEAQLKDPSGGVTSIKNLRIQLVDINARPPHPTLARKFLNTSVLIPTENVRTTPITFEYHKIEIPASVPWFDSWRETFLQVQFPSDHEYTRHFLACVFVISSSEQNPIESLNGLLHNLTTLQSSTNAEIPKWFSANVLKYFVLVHDTLEGNNDIAIQTFETLKQTYGPSNCHFLPTNSRPPDENPLYLPDPWAQFLNCPPRDSTSSSARSSPKSPTESGSVSSMPSSVNSHSGSSTPLSNRSRLEVGQEANEPSSSNIQYHPLSPENENRIISEEGSENSSSPLSSIIWRGSPSSNSSQGIHGCCLTMNDIEALKTLIHDFVVCGLIPYVEKQIQVIQEAISNKKGVSRSLFSATKRWFTPSKPGSSNSATAFNSVIYANDSTEIQLRRLGDLYFMFGNYNMAFQAYHTVKRDFLADQAWLYYSGALEMAGLASFMGGEVNRKSMEYLEESITTYLNICRRPHLATRTTLFSTECLKQKKMYGEAANQFIRMTSEESDLRSALLLEQAAYCFLICSKPKMLRKYAFHIVLSGHRYSKCSQKKHSLRCYRQAYQVYNDKSWSLAEDHIHFTIGRMASSLQLLDEAANSFQNLLTASSRQTAQQQAVFLKEYLFAHQNLIRERTQLQGPQSLPVLPLPLIENDDIKILLGPQQPLRTPGRITASGISFVSNFNDPIHAQWIKLEEMIVQELSGVPIVFKPQVTFFTSKHILQTKPTAIVGEPIQVAFGLRNILQISLPVKDIYLIWNFKGKHNGNLISVSNESSNIDLSDPYIKTHILKTTCIPANSVSEVILSITPLVIGELSIDGIGYTLMNTIPTDNIGQHYVAGKQLFKLKGARLKMKEKDGQPQYAPDRKLEIILAPSAPCLQVSFSEINNELLGNEIQNISIELRNVGSTSLTRIIMASTCPELFSLSNLYPLKKQLKYDKLKCKAFALPICLPAAYNNKLEPGQSYNLNLWMRVPNQSGTKSLDLMFYYENIDPASSPRYRVVKHQWQVQIQDSLDININCQPSYGKNLVETNALCLTVMNSNHIHHAIVSEIVLDHVSIMSKCWKLNNQSLKHRDMKLISQEKVQIFLKVFRMMTLEEPNYSTLKFTKIIEPVNHEVDYCCLDFARRSFTSDPQQFAAPIEFTNSNSLLEALLVIGWRATITDSMGNKRKAIGQHHYCINHLTSKVYIEKEIMPFTIQKKEPLQKISQEMSRSDSSAVNNLQKQVTFNMIHASEINHNFSCGLICITPVTVVINSTVDRPLIVKLNTLGTSNDNAIAPSRYELANPQSLSNFRWIGQSEFLTHLPPFTSVQLSLKCSFITPGTYDLSGRIEIMCRTSNAPYSPVIQNVSYDSAIVVTNSSA